MADRRALARDPVTGRHVEMTDADRLLLGGLSATGVATIAPAAATATVVTIAGATSAAFAVNLGTVLRPTGVDGQVVRAASNVEPQQAMSTVRGVNFRAYLANSAFDVATLIGMEGGGGLLTGYTGTAGMVIAVRATPPIMQSGTAGTVIGLDVPNVTQGATANYAIKTGLGTVQLGDKLTLGGTLKLADFTTGTLPAAAASEGEMVYDTTVSAPVLSDGTNWRNLFDGSTVA